MPWPEFVWYLDGLFAADTRVTRHFFPPKKPDPEQPEEE